MSLNQTSLPDAEKQLISEWRRWMIATYAAITIGIVTAGCIATLQEALPTEMDQPPSAERMAEGRRR